jgi:hypothetical protein
MPASLTPTISSKEPRVVETCRGTAHPVRLRPRP